MLNVTWINTESRAGKYFYVLFDFDFVQLFEIFHFLFKFLFKFDATAHDDFHEMTILLVL